MINSPIKKNPIRHQFDKESGNLYFSIVDVVGIIANTSNPRNYWKITKNRLKKARNQLVTECNQLKMKANDGKFYLTDVGDKEMILKIVRMTSPETLPYFEEYLYRLENKKKDSKYFDVKFSNDPKQTYPQIKKAKQISQNKKRMKTI